MMAPMPSKITRRGALAAAAAAGVVGVLDPEALLLGGESGGLLRDAPDFAAVLREHLQPEQQDLAGRLLPADVADWARGAAVVAARRFITGADPA